jgi:CheY-like chemotaxis protein
VAGGREPAAFRVASGGGRPSPAAVSIEGFIKGGFRCFRQEGVADRTVSLATVHRLRPHREGAGLVLSLRRPRMSGDVAILSPHDEMRLLLRGLLRLHQFRIVREGNGPGSLGEIPDGERAVVVLDADLDELSWSEAIRQFREHRPEVRLVLLTATRSPRVGTQAKACGISAVVRRPFQVHELLEAVSGAGPPVAPPEPVPEPART